MYVIKNDCLLTSFYSISWITNFELSPFRKFELSFFSSIKSFSVTLYISNLIINLSQQYESFLCSMCLQWHWEIAVTGCILPSNEELWQHENGYSRIVTNHNLNFSNFLPNNAAIIVIDVLIFIILASARRRLGVLFKWPPEESALWFSSAHCVYLRKSCYQILISLVQLICEAVLWRARKKK